MKTHYDHVAVVYALYHLYKTSGNDNNRSADSFWTKWGLKRYIYNNFALPKDSSYDLTNDHKFPYVSELKDIISSQYKGILVDCMNRVLTIHSLAKRCYYDKKKFTELKQDLVKIYELKEIVFEDLCHLIGGNPIEADLSTQRLLQKNRKADI